MASLLKQSDTKNGYFMIIAWGLFVVALIIDFKTSSQFPGTWFYLPAIISAFLCSITKKQIYLMGIIACLLPFYDAYTSEMNWVKFLPIIFSRITIIITVLWLSLRYQLEQERSQFLSQKDSLTGVMNQIAFVELLQAEMERSRRKENPFSLVYLDCDNFSRVNETMGHLVADELIISIAETLKLSIRKYDLVGRMGGDEFCLLFPETNLDQSRIIIDRIQNNLSEKLSIKHEELTFSIGVVSFYDIPKTSKEAVNLVDRLMYQVKNSGKNGVQFQAVTSTASDDITV